MEFLEIFESLRYTNFCLTVIMIFIVFDRKGDGGRLGG